MTVIYLCPADKQLCSWEGCARDIKSHFEKEHYDLVFYQDQVEISLETLSHNRLINAGTETYLLQTKSNDRISIQLRLRFLGSVAVASTKMYDLKILVDNVLYEYKALENTTSCIIPNNEGWEVQLNYLLSQHKGMQSLICVLSIQNVKNKMIDEELLPTNIPRNVNETEILDGIHLVEEKLKCLKYQNNHDFMDNVSQLNFSILEEPFSQNPRVSINEKLNLYNVLPNSSEINILECSSCQMDMLPPIYVCTNGHNACTSCQKSPCQICCGSITFNRNIELENFSRTHKHICRYASEGCNEKCWYTDIRAHELRCHYSKYMCQNCSFQGRFKYLEQHIRMVHNSIKLSSRLGNIFGKNCEFYIANESKGIFYCKSSQVKDCICWEVVFCGAKERQLFCELFFKGARFKDPIFLKKNNHIYTVSITVEQLKKMKAKEKYAEMVITVFDN